MDPLTIAITAAGLATSAFKVANVITETILKLGSTDKTLVIFSRQLEVLGSSLDKIETTLKNTNVRAALGIFTAAEAEKHFKTLQASLDGCRTILGQVEDILEAVSSGPLNKGFMKIPAATWKLNAKTPELGQLRGLIDVYVKSIQTETEMMQIFISANTSHNIQDMSTQMITMMSGLREDLMKMRMTLAVHFPSEGSETDRSNLVGLDVLRSHLANSETLVSSASVYFGSKAGTEIAVSTPSSTPRHSYVQRGARLREWIEPSRDLTLETTESYGEEIAQATFKSGMALHALNLLKGQEYEKAEGFYRHYLQTTRLSDQQVPQDTYRAQMHLSLCYLAQAKWERARELLDKVVPEMLSKALHIDLRGILAGLAYLEGLLADARRLTQQLLFDQERTESPGSDPVRSTAMLLSDILDAMNERDNASKWAEAYSPRPVTLIGLAITEGERCIKSTLTSAGYNLETSQSKIEATLWSIQEKRLDLVAFLIKSQPELDFRSSDGHKMFILAIKMNHYEIIKRFVEAGVVDTDDIDDPEIIQGHIDVLSKFVPLDYMVAMRFLVQKGVTSRTQPYRPSSVWNVRKTVLGLFLEADIDLNKLGTYKSALFVALERNYAPMVSVLIEFGADKEERVMGGAESLLSWAVKYRAEQLELIKALTESGVNSEAPGRDSLSPLWSAVLFNRVEIIKILHKAGADPNATDKSGQTMLMMAIENLTMDRSEHIVLIKTLLSCDPDPNKQDRQGRTALWNAVLSDRVDIMQLLFDVGANPDIQDKSGQTALMTAIEKRKSFAIIENLVAMGADLKLQDGLHRNALNYAISSEQSFVAGFLLRTDPKRLPQPKSEAGLEVQPEANQASEVVSRAEAATASASFPAEEGSETSTTAEDNAKLKVESGLEVVEDGSTSSTPNTEALPEEILVSHEAAEIGVGLEGVWSDELQVSQDMSNTTLYEFGMSDAFDKPGVPKTRQSIKATTTLQPHSLQVTELPT